MDDTELVHEPIKKFLEKFVFPDYQVITDNAYNTEQAKRFVFIKIYDLIMLDGDVGDKWGYEIISYIREHNENVTIISSSNYYGFNEQNIDAGADGAIDKTFLYEWNDEGAIFRTRKGKIVREIFDTKQLN